MYLQGSKAFSEKKEGIGREQREGGRTEGVWTACLRPPNILMMKP